MVLLTLSKKITGLVGPFVFRNGLKARNAIGSSNHHWDLLFLSYAQKLISLEVYEESAKVVKQFKYQSALDEWVDKTFDKWFGTDADEQRRLRASVSELRVEVLEENLRPALLPNGQWRDVLAWKDNARVKQWARKEFLISKYGAAVHEALTAYPQLRSSPQLERHPSRKWLMNIVKGSPVSVVDKKAIISGKASMPSSELILRAFQMKQWATTKDSGRIRASVVSIVDKLGGSVGPSWKPSEGIPVSALESIPLDADLNEIPFEDILQIAGGHVKGCGPFNVVCEEGDIYQFWTSDYIKGLSQYIVDRALETKDHLTIVDIGAGDGLLARFLRGQLEKDWKRKIRRASKLQKPEIIATDDGSWKIFPKADVESLDMKGSLEKYTQKDGKLIVLCSWMPMQEDWTQVFRDFGVDEYILVGEADDGTCGCNYLTWGNPDFKNFARIEEGDLTPQEIPGYEKDGYIRSDIDALAAHQFSRFDCEVSKSGKTVSFRRKT
jgi:hypothetical protein